MYHVCETCSEIFTEENWDSWPCCEVNGNKAYQKLDKDPHMNWGCENNTQKGLDSESEHEVPGVGECFYFNSSKAGCPRRNQCGYIHKYGTSTISGRARFYAGNAPKEKPKETSEWRQKDKIKKRRWGNEYLSGKAEEVSEMVPVKPDPNTLIMEYLGDESKNIMQKEMKWGNRRFIKVDKQK